MAFLYWWPADGFTTSVVIPFFKGWLITFGWLWIPFAILVIVGASNAVNLTDGLDGLAIGPDRDRGRGLRGDHVPHRQLPGRRVPAHPQRQGHRRADDLLRRAGGGGARLPLVQQLSRRRCSWATWARWPSAGAIGTLAVLTKSELLLPLIGGIYVVEAALGHHPGGLVQADRQAGLQDGAAAPSLRDQGLGGAQDHRPVLDRVLHAALLALTTLKLR